MGYSEADIKSITPQLISDGWSENHIILLYRW